MVVFQFEWSRGKWLVRVTNNSLKFLFPGQLMPGTVF